MKKSNIILTFIAILVLFTLGCAQTTKPTAHSHFDVYEGIEFDMPRVQEPVIPGNMVNITDFGAVPGGQVLNSQAFADAIDAVTAKGGGKVVIPAGIWLTGPIILKSNLELYTEPGALVIFSTDKDLYPIIETSFEGLDTWRCISPIYGKGLENIAFTGHGVWDGSGDAWRFVKKPKLTDNQWKKLVASGGVVNERGNEWYPSEQFKIAHETANMNVPTGLTTKEEYEAIRDFLRPVMVSIQNSKRVLFDGPTFQNSPAWCIHPLMVEDLTVRNITVRNPWYSQNGDGIDIESCKNVVVYNSNFDVGDDAICIKSGKDEDGRRRGVACENIIIKNNIVYHGHGGVTVGSEMSGGVRNMHVSNCTFMGTDVGLRFKSTRGRGGVVENIFISDIRMTDIPTQAISFDLYYGGKSVSEMLADGGQDIAQPEPVTIETPQFKDIVIRDVVVKGAQQAIFLQGLPEMNLENVVISDMLLEADNGISVIDANGVKISNVKLITKNETAVEFYNAQNVEVSPVL
jgi:polygalacturonase